MYIQRKKKVVPGSDAGIIIHVDTALDKIEAIEEAIATDAMIIQWSLGPYGLAGVGLCAYPKDEKGYAEALQGKVWKANGKKCTFLVQLTKVPKVFKLEAAC